MVLYFPWWTVFINRATKVLLNKSLGKICEKCNETWYLFDFIVILLCCSWFLFSDHDCTLTLQGWTSWGHSHQ